MLSPNAQPGATRRLAPAVLPQTFIDQVNANCQVAAAGQAGQFSLCGTLLRLRQLYKWEHGLPPWREPEPAALPTSTAWPATCARMPLPRTASKA